MNLNEYKKTGVLHLNSEDFNDPGTMEVVNHLMEEIQNGYVKEIQIIAHDLNLNDTYAMCIWYLRTRSRWTQELENKLIEMCREGLDPPNMNEWP